MWRVRHDRTTSVHASMDTLPLFRRRLLLALLTLVIAVHPVAGSERASGLSLAHWMKSILCECEHCGAEDASEEACESELAMSSCCSAEAPKAEERPGFGLDEGCASQCPCTHPFELPLTDIGSLATARDGGASDAHALRRWIAAEAGQLVAVSTPGWAVSTALPDPEPPAARGGPPRRADGFGTLGARPCLERGPGAFLALICTAQI